MANDFPEIEGVVPTFVTATTLRLYESDVTTDGIIRDYTSLFLEVGGVSPRPFCFDHVTFFVDGVQHSTGLELGRRDDLGVFNPESGFRYKISHVVVHFAAPTVNVDYTMDATDGGSVSPEEAHKVVLAGGDYTIICTATPDAGYRFRDWTLDGTVLRGRPAALVLTRWAGSINELHVLKANFLLRTDPSTPPVPDAPYDPDGPSPTHEDIFNKSYIVVYTNCNPSGVATVTPESGITYIGYPGDYRVVICTTALDSPGGDGLEFANWTGTVPIDQQQKYANGRGGSMRVLLQFPPVPGTIRIVRFTANYREEGKCTVSTVAVPGAGGATFGDGEYAPNETCTVVAAAAAGARFLEWKDGSGAVVSRVAAYSFTVTADVDLSAIFRVGAGLILRSASSGRILRGASGEILRNE